MTDAEKEIKCQKECSYSDGFGDGFYAGLTERDSDYRPLLEELELMDQEWCCDDMSNAFIDDEGSTWCERNCKFESPKVPCFLKWIELKHEDATD